MIVGFTGTQIGMSGPQKLRVLKGMRKLKANNPSISALHGDCIGSDEDFHWICVTLEIPVSIAPANVPGKRANCPAPAINDPKPPLERDQDIVNCCTVLVAAPKGFAEELRSGTWATVRRARKAHKPIFIVLPDGSRG